ncbi:MAG: DNA repair protein RecN [Firmicutes bacterium]|nr:DNA repair protein RecN [Bacillota bacterium]
MLVKLVVENLALIDYLDLDFKPGLVVLSGETGAGKSLVLDALSLILGYRASTDLIRHGADRAMVQAIFEVETLPPEYADLVEDGQLIIARELNQNGRSVARINGQLVTASTLRGLGQILVDLHGQHEHQSLLQVEKHRSVLDQFAGSETLALLEETARLAAFFGENERKLRELVGDESEQQRRLDMLRFQHEEIAAAALRADEEEELLATRQRLANYERLHFAVGKAYELLYQGCDRLPAVCDQLGEAVAELTQVERFDSDLCVWIETLQDALYSIEDVARSLRQYRDNLTYDGGTLQAVEYRLDLLTRLKRKYADTIAGIIAYGEKVAAEIRQIENSAELIASLQQEQAEIVKKYQLVADKLTAKRQAAAQELQRQVAKQLADLGLRHAVLEAQVRPMADKKPRRLGQDVVEFMFNANPGEAPKPLAKVISGGEMSRVMLALKTLLARHDVVETLIFDEIDAGLGGRLALAVGQKLRELATTRQVICISHLASIAAMADQHVLIRKEVQEGATYTRVKVLEEEERVAEIARMLDGQVSEISLEHARELLQLVHAK